MYTKYGISHVHIPPTTAPPHPPPPHVCNFYISASPTTPPPPAPAPILLTPIPRTPQDQEHAICYIYSGPCCLWLGDLLSPLMAIFWDA